MTLTNGANEFLGLEPDIPTVLILGGSQGARNINDAVIEALPELTKRYQIIHMTGKKNIEEVKAMANIVLKDNPLATRYHPFDFLNELAMRMSAGVSRVIVSRAGSQIFEIALWNKPSIIIPLPIEISHDQTQNAFEYAKTGSCTVIEEINLSPNILIEEIDRIINNENIFSSMSNNAKAFAISDSAEKIADEILDIALSHEV
jgi:UDP-N-acetylglucosamine--N-acetylmuramyl-(pentapeptide) pyrophosphoryl-undecaprenol N-acetylglucosamine transferase